MTNAFTYKRRKYTNSVDLFVIKSFSDKSINNKWFA